MVKTLALIFLIVSATAPAAEVAADSSSSVPPEIVMPGSDVQLSEFVWIKRPLIVFADSAADPRFVQQMKFITDRLDDLAERDVIVLTDTDPSTDSALRERLHPRGFMLVLIGKDGTIYLRKPLPWDVREITRVIDKMPMRQQEIRDRRGDS